MFQIAICFGSPTWPYHGCPCPIYKTSTALDLRRRIGIHVPTNENRSFAQTLATNAEIGEAQPTPPTPAKDEEAAELDPATGLSQ